MIANLLPSVEGKFQRESLCLLIARPAVKPDAIMKTPTILFLLIIVAGATAVITYRVINREQKEAWAFDTPYCQRVKLKVAGPSADDEKRAIEHFKEVLKQDSYKNYGTAVNLRFGNPPEEQSGPAVDTGAFIKVNPICPAGSMHNTQNVRAATKEKLKEVLDLLDFTSMPTEAASPPPQ